MLATLAAALFAGQLPSIAEIDRMAQARDVEGLSRHLAPHPTFPLNPFPVIRTNGPYDTGRFGWRALALTPAGAGRQYVVLTTPLTSEDIGEILFEIVGQKLHYIREDDLGGVRISRHDADIRLDVSKRSVTFVDDVTFSGDGVPGHFFVRLSPYLTVSKVTEERGKIDFQQAGGIVSLPKPKEKSFNYRISYSGSPRLPQYAGSFDPEELQLTNDYWLPMIGRRPTPFALTVRAPADWTVVAQGKRAPGSAPGITEFVMDMPVSYYSLSAAKYRRLASEASVPKLDAWSKVLSEQQMRWQLELFQPIFAWYQDKLGAFPFERFGALSTDLYGGGALEAYSFATYGPGMLPSEETHEPAHTWFGGKISNTYLRSFWNESFAAFFEGLYARESSIGNISERRQAFAEVAMPSPQYQVATCAFSPPEIGGPASGLGYGKGALVLQMLEREMGTAQLIAAMRRWLAQHPKGTPGEWEDFEAHAVAVGGQRLKVFFDQWLRRKGWPKFNISNVRWAGGKVTGETKFDGDRYLLSTDVMLQFADGTRSFTRVDLTPSFDASGIARFSLPAPSKPTLVSFDPWRTVLRDIGLDEAPISLERSRGMRRFVDPKHPDYLSHLSLPKIQSLPPDLDGIVIVGHPDSLPALRPLSKLAGFEVQGSKLTFRGTAIDLNQGAAMAVVDLAGGKKCVIGLGKTLLPPNIGHARTAIVDRYGRFLRGITEPKTSGKLTHLVGRKGGPVRATAID